MSFFQCDSSNLSPKQSEPTIPLILRGKKKTSQKKSVSPNFAIKPQSVTIRSSNRQVHQTTNHQNIISRQPVLFNQSVAQTQNHVYHPSPAHIRSMSVQRPVSSFPIVGPVSIVRNQPNIHPRPVSVHRPIGRENYRGMEKSEGMDIRKRLDENLGHVFRSLHERRLSFNGPSSKLDSNILIHEPKLQKKLVEQYIQLIYRDYSIPDPLADYQRYFQSEDTERMRNHNNRISVQQSIATEPNIQRTGKKKTEAMMSNSTNKKAVELKESFLIQMFSPADPSSNSSKMEQPQNKSYSGQKYGRGMEQNQNIAGPFMQGRYLTQIEQSQQRQIKESYRYCFMCQQQILQANIEIHQRQKCPQFKSLYQMNISQLRHSLIKKIQRIRNQTQQIHHKLFNPHNPHNHPTQFNSLQKQSSNYLKSIDTNISIENNRNKQISDQFWKHEMKTNFNNVMICYQSQYFKMFQFCRKLQWFVVMLRNLEQRYFGVEDGRVTEGCSRELGKNTRQTEVYESRRMSNLQ